MNDSPSQAGGTRERDLAAARRLAGGALHGVATMQRPPLNGVTVAGLNAAVDDFAERRPAALRWWTGRQPWRASPGCSPPTVSASAPRGYALPGRLVADGVQACPAARSAAAAAQGAARTGARGRGRRAGRPLLVNWGALSRTAPLSGVLAVLTGGAHAVAGAQAQASAAALPDGAEPVLGELASARRGSSDRSTLRRASAGALSSASRSCAARSSSSARARPWARTDPRSARPAAERQRGHDARVGLGHEQRPPRASARCRAPQGARGRARRRARRAGRSPGVCRALCETWDFLPVVQSCQTGH